ncbi:MAG: proline dehydrogenase family protein [Candidatus Dormibacteria bacterium]
MRPAPDMLPTDNLRHLHDRLRSGVALVSQLDDRLRERGNPEGRLAAFARVSDYLQDVVLPHLRAERTVLYPEAARLAGMDPQLVGRLEDNCEELERQVARVLHDHARLRGGVHDNVGCRRHITTLVRLLRRHLQSVEAEVLPCLDGELADGDIHRIYERIQEVSFDEELAGRVPAGAEAAVAAARWLHDSQGIDAELFFLGEYVSDPQLVERTVSTTIEACHLLGSAGLPAHLSIDPTAIGLLSDPDGCRRNIERIARSAGDQPAGRVNLVMLDMEDLRLVEPTLRLHRELLALGLPTGITVQARLRRTADDLSQLLQMPTAVRLVKGAFPLGPEHDHQGGRAVRAAYLALATRMLAPAAREAGVRPVFATHDGALLLRIAALAQSAGWTPDQFEFEMLLGVRVDLQRRLRGEGFSVRAHLPFSTAGQPPAPPGSGEHPAELLHLGEA